MKTVIEVFKGRRDVVAKFWQSKAGKYGYSPMCNNEWTAVCNKPCWGCTNADYIQLSDSLILDHFKGKHILGIYPLLQDNTCHFIAADLDSGNGSNPYDDAVKYRECCLVQDLPCYLLRSKSGKGYHAYIFFDKPVPAWKARLVAFAVLLEAEVIGEDVKLTSFDRLFPNQDELSGKGFGNLIALPFQGQGAKQGHTLMLDPETDFKESFKNQFEILGKISRVTETQLDELIKSWDLKKEKPKHHENINPDGWLQDALRGVKYGNRDATGTKIAGYFINKLPRQDILSILMAWNYHNEPPLKQDDIPKIVNSVNRYKNGEKTNAGFKRIAVSIS